MSEPVVKIAPWENVVLRVIAIYKLLHAAFFIAVGLGLLKLRHHDVVQILNTYVIIPYHLDPENRLVDWALERASEVTPHGLILLSYAAFFYAALFAAEGIGLYLRKHWAEYLVVVVTGSLLPFEIYEMYIYATWWKLVIIVGNFLIVGYLIHRLRLDARNKLASKKKDEENIPAASSSSASRRQAVTELP